MKIFELQDNQVVIDPAILTIPEFNKLWAEDKSKGKAEVFTVFTYIYHCCDHASPYSNYPVNKREEAVRHDLITDKNWKISKSVKEAIEKYNKLTTTPLERLLQSTQRKVDEIAQYLDEEPVDNDSIKPILEVFNKLTATVTNFGKLNEAVTKEQKANNTKRRGEKASSMFED